MVVMVKVAGLEVPAVVSLIVILVDMKVFMVVVWVPLLEMSGAVGTSERWTLR